MSGAAQFDDGLCVTVAATELATGAAVALRFYHHTQACAAEKRAFASKAARAASPAARAFVEDAAARAVTGLPAPLNTRRLPPALVLSKGQTLESVMQRRPPDFVPALQVRRPVLPGSAPCRGCARSSGSPLARAVYTLQALHPPSCCRLMQLAVAPWAQVAWVGPLSLAVLCEVGPAVPARRATGKFTMPIANHVRPSRRR